MEEGTDRRKKIAVADLTNLELDKAKRGWNRWTYHGVTVNDTIVSPSSGEVEVTYDSPSDEESEDVPDFSSNEVSSGRQKRQRSEPAGRSEQYLLTSQPGSGWEQACTNQLDGIQGDKMPVVIVLPPHFVECAFTLPVVESLFVEF